MLVFIFGIFVFNPVLKRELVRRDVLETIKSQPWADLLLVDLIIVKQLTFNLRLFKISIKSVKYDLRLETNIH